MNYGSIGSESPCLKKGTCSFKTINKEASRTLWFVWVDMTVLQQHPSITNIRFHILHPAEQTDPEWWDLAVSVHLLFPPFPFILSSPSQYAFLIQFSSPPLSVCLSSFLLFLPLLFNYHGNRWCGSSPRNHRFLHPSHTLTRSVY